MPCGTDPTDSPLFHRLCCPCKRDSDPPVVTIPRIPRKTNSRSTLASFQSRSNLNSDINTRRSWIPFTLNSIQRFLGNKTRRRGTKSKLSGGARRFSAFRHRERPSINVRKSTLEYRENKVYEVIEMQKVLPPSRRQSLMQWIAEQLRQAAQKCSTVSIPDTNVLSSDRSPSRARRAARRQLSAFRRRSPSTNTEDENRRPSDPTPTQKQSMKGDHSRKSSFKRILSVVLRPKHSKLRVRSGLEKKSSTVDTGQEQELQSNGEGNRSKLTIRAPTNCKSPTEEIASEKVEPKEHQPLTRAPGRLVAIADVHQ